MSSDMPSGFCARCLLNSVQDRQTDSLEAEFPNINLPNIRIIERIGSGAMSVVFRARQLMLKRDVAVKLINPNLSRDPEFVERFFREAQAMAILNHSNIVGVYEVGESHSGDLYLVMELVEGNDVRSILLERALDFRDTIRWLIQICHALEFSHKRGVVHRDIKPSNILIDANGNAKLADFGIARLDLGVEGESLTATTSTIGTPEYIAPELLRDVNRSASPGDVEVAVPPGTGIG